MEQLRRDLRRHQRHRHDDQLSRCRWGHERARTILPRAAGAVGLQTAEPFATTYGATHRGRLAPLDSANAFCEFIAMRPVRDAAMLLLAILNLTFIPADHSPFTLSRFGRTQPEPRCTCG